MIFPRDVIVILGLPRCGKSRARRIIEQTFRYQGYTSTTLDVGGYASLVALANEDATQQFHKRLDHRVEPFVVTSNRLLDRILIEKMMFLVDAERKENHFYLYDDFGGVNLFAQSLYGAPLSQVDRSFERIAKEFLFVNPDIKKSLLSRWLFVLHVTADYETRHKFLMEGLKQATLNTTRIPGLEVRWDKPEAVLDLYGEDDFYKIIELLRLEFLHVEEIHNKGTSDFDREVSKIARRQLSRLEAQSS